MNFLIITLAGILGATLTFYISEHLKQGPVRASSLLLLSIGLFFYFYPTILSPYLTKNIKIVFIGTTFIGMVSLKTKGRFIQLAVAGCLFSLIYLHKSHLFDGYGGALGVLAFNALLATLGFSFLLSKSTKKLKPILNSRKKRIKNN